jgi:hypothetical protein
MMDILLALIARKGKSQWCFTMSGGPAHMPKQSMFLRISEGCVVVLTLKHAFSMESLAYAWNPAITCGRVDRNGEYQRPS